MRTDNKKNVFLRFFIVLGLCLALPSLANARVNGPCGKCHTMHSSQDGTSATQIFIGTDAGWSGGVLTASAPGGPPQPQLLKTDCIGCHSSADGVNVVDGVPIVWNTSTQPPKDLAAGNFSYVAGGAANEGYGHNVLGISSDADTTLLFAPGMVGTGCANSCHISLALPTNTTGKGDGKVGCEGCHLHVGHHDGTSNPGDLPIGPVDGGGDAYRFLGGHDGWGIVGNNAGVAGAGDYLEDPDWKANVYMTDAFLASNDGGMSIGTFCAGCHKAFHAPGFEDLDWGVDNSPSGAWLRHPTNVNLPLNATGDFQLKPDGVLNDDYNPDYPLARSDVASLAGTVWTSDQVMCLSCHKAHATAHKDALRFSYDGATSDAHSGVGRATGCFYCHRAKDL